MNSLLNYRGYLDSEESLNHLFHIFLITYCLMKYLCTSDILYCLRNLYSRQSCELIYKFEISLCVICRIDSCHNASRELIRACCRSYKCRSILISCFFLKLVIYINRNSSMCIYYISVLIIDLSDGLGNFITCYRRSGTDSSSSDL